MSKSDDDNNNSNNDIDAGMTTAERRRRKRRGGGLRVPSDNVPRRSAAVVAPVPEDPSLAVSIAYSFSDDSSEPMTRVDPSELSAAANTLPGFEARTTSPGFDPRMTVPGFVPSFDPVAPDSAVTLIEPASDGGFESKTREMSVVDLESLGLQDPSGEPGVRPSNQPAPPILPAMPSVIVTPNHQRAKRESETQITIEDVAPVVVAPVVPEAPTRAATAPIPGLVDARVAPAVVAAPARAATAPIAERAAAQGADVEPARPSAPIITFVEPAATASAMPAGLQHVDAVVADHFPRSVSAGWSAPVSNAMPAVSEPDDFESFETRTSERPLFSRADRAGTVALSDAEIEDLGTGDRDFTDSDDIPVDMDDSPADAVVPHVAAALDEPPARPPAASSPPPPPPTLTAVPLAMPAISSGPSSVPPAIPAAGLAAATPTPSVPPPPPAKASPPTPPPPKAVDKEKDKDREKDKRAAEKKAKNQSWFVDVFGEDYLRTLPFLTPQATRSEAEFVLSALEIAPGAQLLDVGCGYGRHAMELAARGYHVVGLDLSLPLLVRGGEEANRRGLTINFVHGDMRELDFDNQFDGAYCLFSTFGYFDDETNKKTASNIARALKPGGRLVLEILNRDYIVADLPTRVWWEGEGCVILEEVDFNYFFSRVVVNRSVVFDDGRQADQEISLRAYSLHEIGRVLHGAGFRVLEVSGGYQTKGRFFGNQSRHIVVVAEKKDDKAS